MRDIFKKLVEKWPSSIVARTEVWSFSGGAYSGKTLANRASEGEEVPESFRVGKKVCYEAQELANYLSSKATTNEVTSNKEPSLKFLDENKKRVEK